MHGYTSFVQVDTACALFWYILLSVEPLLGCGVLDAPCYVRRLWIPVPLQQISFFGGLQCQMRFFGMPIEMCQLVQGIIVRRRVSIAFSVGPIVVWSANHLIHDPCPPRTSNESEVGIPFLFPILYWFRRVEREWNMIDWKLDTFNSGLDMSDSSSPEFHVFINNFCVVTLSSCTWGFKLHAFSMYCTYSTADMAKRSKRYRDLSIVIHTCGCGPPLCVASTSPQRRAGKVLVRALSSNVTTAAGDMNTCK